MTHKEKLKELKKNRKRIWNSKSENKNKIDSLYKEINKLKKWIR